MKKPRRKEQDYADTRPEPVTRSHIVIRTPIDELDVSGGRIMVLPRPLSFETCWKTQVDNAGEVSGVLMSRIEIAGTLAHYPDRLEA
jgi:hypothetical protein